MFSKGDTWTYGNMETWYDLSEHHIRNPYRYSLWNVCYKCGREFQQTPAEWWYIYYQTGQLTKKSICRECARVR